MDELIRQALARAPQPDLESKTAVLKRANNILRPTGALARLDETCAWLASWQRTARPMVEHPAVVVFAADHGVTVEGVSAYPAEVTMAMLKALRDGVATAAAMARAIGAQIEVVDAGVADPTGNITVEPALSPDLFEARFQQGRDAVAGLDCDLLVFGEMGIGNTTPAAAVAATLFGGPAEDWTGRGTGIDDETRARKIAVVEKARARVAPDARPLEIVRQVGGSELVAIAGGITEARLRSIPVVLDGFVVTAAAAALDVLVPGSLAHCLAGHRSPEPGHGLLLDKLGLQPLLDLEMRLGEGSGALAAVPLVRLATAVVNDVATFEEFGLTR